MPTYDFKLSEFYTENTDESFQNKIADMLFTCNEFRDDFKIKYKLVYGNIASTNVETMCVELEELRKQSKLIFDHEKQLILESEKAEKAIRNLKLIQASKTIFQALLVGSVVGIILQTFGTIVPEHYPKIEIKMHQRLKELVDLIVNEKIASIKRKYVLEKRKIELFLYLLNYFKKLIRLLRKHGFSIGMAVGIVEAILMSKDMMKLIRWILEEIARSAIIQKRLESIHKLEERLKRWGLGRLDRLARIKHLKSLREKLKGLFLIQKIKEKTKFLAKIKKLISTKRIRPILSIKLQEEKLEDLSSVVINPISETNQTSSFFIGMLVLGLLYPFCKEVIVKEKLIESKEFIIAMEKIKELLWSIKKKPMSKSIVKVILKRMGKQGIPIDSELLQLVEVID
jgi:hypothetical protein